MGLPPHGRRASDRESRVARRRGAPPTWPSRQRPGIQGRRRPSPPRRPSNPAIRPWRLRPDGYTLPSCVTRPPPASACWTQPAGSPRGAGIARKAVRRAPKTVRVGRNESYLRRAVSKLIRSPEKNSELNQIAGVPLVLRGHPREGRPLHPTVIPAPTPPSFPRKRESRAGRRRGAPPTRPSRQRPATRPKSNQIANPMPKPPPRPQKQTIALFALSSFRKREKTLNYPPKLNIQTRPPAPPPSPHMAVAPATAQRPGIQGGAPGWRGLLHPPNLACHGELRKGLRKRESIPH